jgi:ribosomal protein S6--L-glutamate ligase
MRLYFLLVRRVPPEPSPVLVEVFEILSRRGFEIEAGVVEDLLTPPQSFRADHDLYVLKSHTELALSIAGALHTSGAALLNPYESCSTTQNKIIASRRLWAAGVPTPRSWVTDDLTLLNEVVEETPLILKPYRGHRGAGISIVNDTADLARVPRPEEPMLAQEYVPGSGEDVKLYVVGRDVFAVRKPFSANSFTVPGRPCAVSDELRDIARRCGDALGLGLYGLDIVEGSRGPVVVDVNYFPGYKGVPDVAPLIAGYIEGYARGFHTLELPVLRVSGDDEVGLGTSPAGLTGVPAPTVTNLPGR